MRCSEVRLVLTFSIRVPPFLLSIDDPRAAQGASLKGCPVCGGMFEVFIQYVDMLTRE